MNPFELLRGQRLTETESEMATAAELQAQLATANAEIERMRNVPRPEVSRVAVKNAPFFREQPELYFLQIEAQFRNAGITVDQTKYDHVIAQFDPKYLCKVSDFLSVDTNHGKYSELKDRILKEFTDSAQKKLKQLIEGIELGDDKPSQLLKRMKELAGNSLTDEAIKTLFIQRRCGRMGETR